MLSTLIIMNKIHSFKHSFSNLDETSSLFHLNISSLNLHSEELHLTFTHMEHKLSDSSKINDLSLSGYTLHHQPTKSFCGGAAIYVNNKLDNFLRNDLSICQKEFETICTETKTSFASVSIDIQTLIKKFNLHIFLILFCKK